MQQNIAATPICPVLSRTDRSITGCEPMAFMLNKSADDQVAATGTPGRRGVARRARRPMSLALQGGGSFGAFTWGVLDRLLEKDGFRFDAVSGTSAGAVNAVLLADGLAEGGPEAARRKLERFWKCVSRAAPLGSLGQTPAGTVAMAAMRM